MAYCRSRWFRAFATRCRLNFITKATKANTPRTTLTENPIRRGVLDTHVLTLTYPAPKLKEWSLLGSQLLVGPHVIVDTFPIDTRSWSVIAHTLTPFSFCTASSSNSSWSIPMLIGDGYWIGFASNHHQVISMWRQVLGDRLTGCYMFVKVKRQYGTIESRDNHIPRENRIARAPVTYNDCIRCSGNVWS